MQRWYARLAAVLLASLSGAGYSSEAPTASLIRQPIRIEILKGESEITLYTAGLTTMVHRQGSRVLPAGRWTFHLTKAQAPRQYFHIFPKSFPGNQRAQAQAYVEAWKSRGYRAELKEFGTQYRAQSGRILDNRVFWVSLARFEKLFHAEMMREKLAKNNIWAWIRPEIVSAGQGQIQVQGPAAASMVIETPIRLTGPDPITLVAKHGNATLPENRSYTGELELAVGPDGLLKVFETLPFETYLSGVLPREMPSLWPLEAIKAQAVAARSEAIVNGAAKHALEGFQFCSAEHCRVYGGAGARQAATDRAVAETAGQVITDGRRIIPAVFSSNCGGHTEHNDAVWSSPADPALRGVPDMPRNPRAATYKQSPSAIEAWIMRPPRAFCSGDEQYFRWERRYGLDELTTIVNRHHPVGVVRDIQLGDRGVSGRLKWVRVVGSDGEAVIKKEYPIRLAFGGLPSALFTIKKGYNKRSLGAVTFYGGGRGHGVGLCQHGARGLALTGADYMVILGHYFTAVTTERIR